jgi:subtilisin
VGVIDSGADMHHPDLEDAIEGGANCVPESVRPPGDFGPDDAHGTHVAGTIAARGTPPGGVRGVAPGARLRIYRVFEAGNQSSGSSFAIIDAVERAIEDRCDIINLSLGFDPGVTDDAVSDALRKARNHGILAVAAAGNGGREPVEFPASDDACLAVSASGRKGLFPPTATEVDDVGRPFGADRRDFIAAFSNVGADLDATGAGVGVVSTMPGGYGPMSGTSMASPAVAAMAARLLARHPRVRRMKRTAARADAIRQLVIDAARSLGFGALFEGAGLPR